MARKVLRPDAVPSKFAWLQDAKGHERMMRAEEREKKRKRLMSDSPASSAASEPDSCVVTDFTDCIEEEVETDCNQEKYIEMSVQTDPMESTCQCSEASCNCCCHSSKRKEPTIYINKFVDDPKGLKYYTGCESLPRFFSILHSLGPAAHQLTYWEDIKPKLVVHDQLLLTLMKIRTYKPNFELSRYFDIPENEVRAIFVTWIRFMSLQWREIDIWPDKELIQFYAPCDFKKKFPSTRLVIDGVEIPIKKPSKPVSQQATFSTYKNRNTAKALVGITPGGMVSYVSDCYGGSTSDRQIVERGSLLNKTEPGDSIMADKGFNVQDLFEASNVIINIPTFFRKKNRMNNETVLRDRKISSKRVHVERVIGLAKTYKILTHPLNTSETLLSSDILFICFMLANFRQCIVHKHA